MIGRDEFDDYHEELDKTAMLVLFEIKLSPLPLNKEMLTL